MHTVETRLPLFPEMEKIRRDTRLESCENLAAAPEDRQTYLFPTLVHDADAHHSVDCYGTNEEEDVIISAEQLSFDFFLQNNISHISDYISKRRNGLLDRDILSFCARDHRLHKVSFELYEIGAKRIGYVVQMTRAELMAKTSATEAITDRLQRHLQAAGLDFGMTPLGWKPGQSR